MPGKYGFDFDGASQSFNVLAEYLFGKVVANVWSLKKFYLLNIDFIIIAIFSPVVLCDELRIRERSKWR